MKHITKRLLALLLMLAMVFSLLPAMAFAAEDEMPQVDYITAEDDALVEADVLSDIDSYFDLSAKRDGELTLADYVAASDDLKALVQESDTYVEGSLVERGDGFFWQTTAGITCGYFPKDRYEANQRVATKAVNTSSLATWNYANATSKDVCLVAPMYSEDSTFTDQYVNEALSIAEALGGTAYGLIDTAATVTAIGQALEKCGVVIFDSHGNTDWGYFDGGSDGTGEADCVTQANTSYLCLSTGTGMTTADCAYVTGNFGTYPHAYKDSYGNYVADGTAFANHMNSNAPGSLLWMAICLGMSTEGFCTPLRNKGVSVVYGYSQSVTFYGDYLYEEYFWDKMIAGETVATAAAYMKTTAGCKWDPYYSSYSESSARRAYAAFPVVVSDQDTYPGQRSSTSNGACSVQTVKSTYTLFNNYTISASTNNSNYGTVSVNGNVITASPKDGYYAKSYTVLSGTATVTQNGNIFTVDASSDCSIRINFAAKSSVTVSFSGVSGVSALTGYAGDEMTLPTVTAPEGYTFLGWTTASVNEAVTEKPEYFTVYTPTASITLYPLYSYTVAGGGSTEYVLTDIGEISATDSVVVTMTYTDGTVYALYNANGTSSAPTATIVTVSGDKLAATPDSTILWNIGGDASGYIFYPEGTTDTWLYCIANNNGVRVGTNTANTFVIDSASGYLKHTGTGRYVGVYRTNPDWRCYTNTTSNTADQTLGFYVKGQGGTTYYTSVTGPACEHTNTTTSTVDPTCTAAGSTTVTCDDCGAVVSTTTIDALGHSYGNGVVTEPTCTEGGYTTYTCTVCGDSYQGDATAPNGHNYADGTCTVCGEAEPTTPPTEGYEGRYYIASIRSSGNYFYMSSDLGTASTKRYQAVDSGLTTLPASIAEADVVANQVFVLELNTDGTYSIYAEAVTGDNYLGWTSGNSGTLVAADSALALTVDYADGIYNIHFAASDAERYLALNGTSGNNYFAWYKSGQKQDLVLIPVGGNAPETPDPEPSCEHTNTTTATVDPTCTAAGSTTVTCDDCGAVVSTTTIDALGHSYGNGVVTEPTCTEGGYTTYTCTVCGDSYQGDATEPNGHNYVDGVCTVCGEAEPTTPPTEGYEGRYYIATIRSSGNYFYMNSDLGTASTKRYQAVDSGLTILPASIAEADVVANQVFVLELNADGTYSIYAEAVAGDNYLGWTSGNSGTLVAADSALALTVDYADGIYNIHFAASDAERYLALNGTSGNNYFAWYKSGQKQDLVLIPVGGDAPETPDPEPSCEHTNTTTTTVDPTCTAAGSTTVICDDCGTVVSTSTIDALGHSYGNGVVTEPTCTEGGYTTYTCTVCGDSYQGDATEPNGHNYVDGVCTVCGAAEPTTPPTEGYEGRYYIASIRSSGNYFYMNSDLGTASTKRYQAVDSGLTTLPASIAEADVVANQVFVLELNADGTYSIYAEAVTGDNYLGWTSGNSGTLVAAASALALTVDYADGIYNIHFAASDAERYLALNGTSGNNYFAWYKSGQKQDLVLIPVGGDAPGTPDPEPSCEHTNTTTTTVDPTCTAAGSTTVTCDDCGTVVSTTTIDALGHSYGNGVVTEPTCTEGGYTTYTCTVCGDSYQDDATEPSGHNYVDGTCTVCGEAEPTTPPTERYEGRYYIASIRSSGNYFYMSSDLGTASTKRYQAVDSGLTALPSSIAEADVVANQVFALELNADGTYSIYAEAVTGDNYLGWTSGNSGTLVAADSALALTVDYTDGIYNIHFAASDAERYLALNGTSGNNYFAWYKSGQKQDLVLIPVGGNAPETPDPEPSCEHTNTTVTGAVEASCTEAGYTGDTVCDDCGETIDTGTAIDALGHSYVDGICTNCGEAEPAATDYSGRYYIAGIRSADTNYQYLLGAMDGSRYDIEDSGLTTLPTEITDPAANKIFVIEKNADGTYSIYAEGITDEYKYLGWTSGNSGTFVTADSALSLSIDALESGLVNIYFYSEGDAQNRYLSLNATATNTYAAWYKSGQTKDLALIPVTGEAPEHVHVPTYFAGQAATCEAEGVVEYWYCSDEACPNYGTCYSDEALTVVIASEDLIIEALGHNMVAGTVHAPTCTEEGYTEYACANGCGTTDIGDIIDALGHDMVAGTVHAPTCTEEGYTEYACANGCGTTDIGDIIDALGHDMTYTDNGDGTHTYGCAYDCDIEDVVEDHVYIDGICPCGAEEVIIPAEPTEVAVKMSHTVSFDSDLKMNYRIKKSNIAAVVSNYVTDGAYLVVEKDRYPQGGGEKTVETVTLYPDLTTDAERMLFSLPGIQSVEMGSELRAVLHFFDADGNEYYTTVDTYSVLAYAQLCFDYYSPETDGYLFTMLIDCMNYGAAAQVAFDRRADELVNAGLEAYQQYASTQLSAELTDVRTYVDNDRSITAVTAMGFNVNFADKTEISAKLTIAEGYGKEDITSVKVLNEAGEVVDTLTEFTELDDGRLQVTFTGVNSVNMRDMYYFVAYVGDQVASQNVGYSIEAYAKNNINSADTALAALVRSCIYYGDSAKVYFDSLLG